MQWHSDTLTLDMTPTSSDIASAPQDFLLTYEISYTHNGQKIVYYSEDLTVTFDDCSSSSMLGDFTLEDN